VVTGELECCNHACNTAQIFKDDLILRDYFLKIPKRRGKGQLLQRRKSLLPPTEFGP
jgi:hypothetical protein